MTLIRVSNRLGVKQINVFLSFLKAFIWPKCWCQKIDKNINYQLAIMTFIRISNRLAIIVILAKTAKIDPKITQNFELKS